MIFNKQLQINIITKDVQFNPYVCNEAVVIEIVNGKGTLTKKVCYDIDERDFHYESLFLNDLPLFNALLHFCSTSQGMLATGYGIDNINCPELIESNNSLNMDYSTIEIAIQRMMPILGLLESGIYVIADTNPYPTDGENNFFWNVSNQFVDVHATQYAHDLESWRWSDPQPLFLYPSQSTQHYNEARVNDYLEKTHDLKKYPRAIAYHFEEGINVLLDGHHKASACALALQKVPCLTIIPYSQFSPPKKDERAFFSTFSISANILTKNQRASLKKTRENYPLNTTLYPSLSRAWESKFLDTRYYYPTASEVFEVDFTHFTGLIDQKEINQVLETIKDKTLAFGKIQKGFQLKGADILISFYIKELSFKQPEYATELAMQYLLLYRATNTIETALRCLIRFKNDKVEQFLIDYLVVFETLDQKYKEIALSYWS